MIAVYIDSDLQRFNKKIRYTCNFLFKTLGYEFKFISRIDQLLDNDILFFYGLLEPSAKEAYILAMNKIMFFIPVETDLLEPGKFSLQDVKNYTREIKLIQKIPIISKNEIKVPLQFSKQKDLFYGVFKFDLIGNLFFSLSSYDELKCEKKDKHNRVPDTEISFLKFQFTPYVNIFLWFADNCIGDAISEMDNYFLMKKEYWPGAESLAVSFSHNIDKLRKWNFKSMIKSSFEDIFMIYKIKYFVNNLISRLKYILTNIEDYWTFDVIEELENHHQIRSTMFWGTESYTQYDIDYDIKDNEVYKELTSSLNRGSEIALLASYNSSRNDILERQKDRIIQFTGMEKLGVRHNHYRYDMEITAEFHKKNCFVYDSSRGFLHRNGFKYGIGFPHYLHSESTSDSNNPCLEIPRIFTDSTLKLSRTKLVSFERTQAIIDELLLSVASVNGLLTFNFSSSNFADIPYNKELFSYILDEIKPKNVFATTFMEIAEWWKKRESVEITETENGVSVYFPDKIEKFSLSLKGKYEMTKTVDVDSKIEGSMLVFTNVLPNTRVNIILRKMKKKKNPEGLVS